MFPRFSEAVHRNADYAMESYRKTLDRCVPGDRKCHNSQMAYQGSAHHRDDHFAAAAESAGPENKGGAGDKARQ